MDVADILIPIVVSMVMAFLVAASKKTPIEDETGSKVLRFPTFYKIVAYFVMGFGLFFLISSIFTGNNEDWGFGIGMFVFCAFLSVPLFLCCYNYRLKINSEFLEQSNLLRKVKRIRWDEIKGMSFDIISQQITIRGEKQKITVHAHLIGFTFLLEQIERKTGYTRKKLGITDM